MSKRIPAQRSGSPNDFYSPYEVLDPLYAYIPSGSIIWESACGSGNLVKELQRRGYEVIGSDIQEGYDYFTYQPDTWNLSITNPPYSLKTQWLKRSYELGKPFSLLCPYTLLEGQERQELFRACGIEIVFINKRYKFETASQLGRSSPWFPTAWFTYGFNIGKQLTFYDAKTINGEAA
jgi:hypothetical protein